MEYTAKSYTIKGAYNQAVCYTVTLDEKAAQQVEEVCNQDAFRDAVIRIMPDAHAGKGCTIGTTMTISNRVVPGMVGVDIGCGMETVRLDASEIDLQKLDKYIHAAIPSGTNIRRTPHEYGQYINLQELYCADKLNLERAVRSIGTLGGGNHFIEIDQAEDGTLYLVVHSGSRHIGNEVAQYYQRLAKQYAKEHDIAIPQDLTYVEGALFDRYIHDMKLMQQYALWNRKAIADSIMAHMDFQATERFTTIHNYIDTEEMILRKGAIAAHKDEIVLIPINMRDGSVLAIGKGNPEWNYSAPHGAGRVMSRTKAKSSLSMDEYKEMMSGVYTTSVNEATLDEAPMAYKRLEDIIDVIKESVEVIDVMKPIYNFKASE